MSTLAEQQLRVFATDRRVYLKRLIDNAASTPETQSRLIEIADESEIFGDPTTRYMEWISRSVVEAIQALPMAKRCRRIEDVCFSMLEENDVTATTSIFPDDSGLIIISDALPSLLYHLAALNAKMKSRVGGRSLHEEVACAVLRFHVLQQRMYGLAGKCKVLLNETEEAGARNLAASALRFVLAHEVGHYILGHSSKLQKFQTSARLPIIDDHFQMELAADAFAIQVQRAYITANNGRRRSWLAFASALLAMQAIEVMEYGLFIRRARSHPHPTTRWRELCNGVSMKDTLPVRHHLLPLMRICTVAENPKRALPPNYWVGLRSSEHILREHRPDEYLAVTAELDRFLATDTVKLHRFLEKAQTEHGVDLVSGISKLFSQGPTEVLASWGLPSNAIGPLTDPTIALTFHSLYSRIQTSPLLQGDLANGMHTMLAIAGARLIEGSLGDSYDPER